MAHVRTIGTAILRSFLVAWGWALLHGTAVAQVAQAKKEESGGNSYVFSYFLVLLGIVAGMILVCRSSNRRDRARPEQYSKSSPAAKK